MQILAGHRSRLHDLAFSPDSRHLASVAGYETVVSVWDLGTGRRGLLSQHWGRVTGLAFSPNDPDLLASGDRSGWVCLWDVPRRRVRGAMIPRTQSVHGLAFAPDGETVATNQWNWYGQYQVEVWTVSEPKEALLLHSGRSPVCIPAFHPSRKLLAGGDRTGIVWVWSHRNPTRGEALRHKGPVYSVAFAPDGKTLAVATGWKIVLWDLKRRRSLHTLTGHEKLVSQVAFTPDGRSLLSASHDGTARVWEPGTSQPVAAYDWEIGPLSALAVAPDGMRAAVGGTGTIVLWDLG